MKRLHIFVVVAFCISIVVSSTTYTVVLPVLAEGTADIPLYGVYEQSFTAASSYAYKQAPSLQVTFTGTSGPANGTSLAVRGFWDGGASFKVRFSPRLEGNWQYTSSSSDAGLNGQSGAFSVTGTLPVEHASHHGHVTANPKHPFTLMYADGTPFFLMGDTQWSFSTGEISWPDEFKTYVDARAGQGFNYIHGVAYEVWPKGNDKNEGGQSFQGNNVDELNPGYWQAFDRRVAYMNSKGIVVGFLLSWADQGWKNFSQQEQVERYAQYVIDRYAAYNLIWIIAGEYEEAGIPGGFNNLGNYIKNNDLYNHPRTTHTVDTSGDDFGKESWLTVVYQQLKENLGTNITQDRTYGKPVINSEYGYEGNIPAEDVRRGAWEIVVSGGFFVYGNTATYHHDAVMSKEKLDSPGARYSTYLKKFFTQKTRWWELKPDNKLVSGDGLYGLSNQGNEYVVYIKNVGKTNYSPVCQRQIGSDLVVDLSGASATDAFSVVWYDPKTGEEVSGGGINGGGPRMLAPPFSGDVALLLKKDAGALSASFLSPQAVFSIDGEMRLYIPMVIKC